MKEESTKKEKHLTCLYLIYLSFLQLLPIFQFAPSFWDHFPADLSSFPGTVLPFHPRIPRQTFQTWDQPDHLQGEHAKIKQA